MFPLSEVMGDHTMYLILIIVLLVVVLGGLPVAPWGTWHPYGWAPSGIVGVVLLVLLVLVLLGRL
jgi:Protein of unknown function (DUF3309)